MVLFEEIRSGKNLNRFFERSNIDQVNVDNLVNNKKYFIIKIYEMYFLCGVFGKTLFVLCGEGEGLEKSSLAMIELCTARKFEKIEFVTVRKGMIKVLTKYGFCVINKEDNKNILEKRL